jgi:signal transduction histidine kinase
MTPPLHILHLEDDPNDAALVQSILEAEGIAFAITCVQTRDGFVAALEQGGIDLILSDYTLPAFDGMSALKITNDQWPAIPLIFVSGTLGEERAVELLKSGATDYVLKDRLIRLVPSVHRAMQEVKERAGRQQAEANRTEYSGKIKMLSRRLVEAQESERRKLARELNEEIGQALTVAQMHLQALLQSPGAATLAPGLHESLTAVERVLEQVEGLSLNLRPALLDDLGLEPALRWYTNRQATLAALQVEVRVDPLEQRLDPIIEIQCFRIAQEALTNVVRHAKARAVNVDVSQNGEQLHLSVRDDGVGFDVASVREQAVRGASLGLLGMEERATLAGGGLQYHAAPGRGTEVHAWFPLKWADPTTLIETI